MILISLNRLIIIICFLLFLFQAFDQSQPIRSQKSPATSMPSSSAPLKSSPNNSEKTATNVDNANEFKRRGNDCVKAGQYQKAILYYTEAIRLNKFEAVYLTNRALCYLKQQKYLECIEDCSIAITLDEKAVKAYYRRMQAREQMNDGDLNEAMRDCQMLLKIEPKNSDAQRSLERIKKRLSDAKSDATSVVTKLLDGERKNQFENENFLLRETSTTATSIKVAKTDVGQAPWSKFTNMPDYERIDFVSKAPHLRSKQTLKRIPIGNCRSTEQTTKNVGEHLSSNKSKEPKISDVEVLNKESLQPSIPIDLVVPKTTAQFYKAWSSTKDEKRKFEILKVKQNHISVQKHYFDKTFSFIVNHR